MTKETLLLLAVALTGFSAHASDTFWRVYNTPTANEERLERIDRREVKRLERKSEPVFISKGLEPPHSDGKREYNALGSVYCGKQGCWR